MNPLIKLTAAAGIALALPATAAQASHRLYMPLGSAGAVLTIDTATDRPIRTVKGTPDAHGLAAVAGGKYLVVGRYSEVERKAGTMPKKPKGVSKADHKAHHAKPGKGDMAKGDMAKGGKAKGDMAKGHMAKGGKAKSGMAKGSAMSDTVSYLSLIPIGGDEVVRRIEVPGAMHHVALTPDAKTAIVSQPAKGGIAVVDLEAGATVKTLATGPMSNYVVVNRDGSKVYVSNAGNGTVSEIDTKRWILLRNFVIGESAGHMILSRDGKRLYVADSDAGTVVAVNTGDGKIAKTYAIGGQLHGLDVSDDGRTLFVAAMEQDKLAAINLEDGSIRMAPLAPSPFHVAVAPGLGKLYISSAEGGRIWSVSQDTLKVITEIPIRGEGHQMAIFAH